MVELEPGKASNSKQFAWSGEAAQTFIRVLRYYLTDLGQDLNSFRVRSLHTLCLTCYGKQDPKHRDHNESKCTYGTNNGDQLLMK